MTFLDEAFIELADPSQSMVGCRDDSLFVLRSLTKSFAVPGLRFGYGFGEPGLIERMEIARPPWSVNAYAEQFAIAAFGVYDQTRRSPGNISGASVRGSPGNFPRSGCIHTLRRQILSSSICRLPQVMYRALLQEKGSSCGTAHHLVSRRRSGSRFGGTRRTNTSSGRYQSACPDHGRRGGQQAQPRRETARECLRATHDRVRIRCLP